VQVDEDEKKKKRMERFGISAATSDASGPKKVKLGSTNSDVDVRYYYIAVHV
jgi:hypothetical protein